MISEISGKPREVISESQSKYIDVSGKKPVQEKRHCSDVINDGRIWLSHNALLPNLRTTDSVPVLLGVDQHRGEMQETGKDNYVREEGKKKSELHAVDTN